MDTVIITGASRGLGASAAIHAARRGMGVILTYNSHAAGAEEVVSRGRQGRRAGAGCGAGGILPGLPRYGGGRAAIDLGP